MSDFCALCGGALDSDVHRAECARLRRPEDGWPGLSPTELAENPRPEQRAEILAERAKLLRERRR